MLRVGLLFLAFTLSGCEGGANDLLKSEEQQTIEAVNKEMGELNQALLQAVQNGDQDQIKKLLADGADIDATDDRGRTSAMIAVHTDQLEIFQLLVEKGANINIRDQRLDNPLLYAGAEGKIDFVKAAIAAGADTTITNRFGGTALIPAADRGHVEVVRELLANSDVDVNHVNNLGWTALLEAVILGDGGKNHQEIVKLLIDHGADVNLADHDGVTPLQHAKKRGYQEMIELLTNAGAK
ncbi:ankyrin repeat domain-containing protein [Brevibacillus panacihumi]|uniref:Ankyrin repeat domain-containing protein n=1 Tax=Brevibacillus panacihumi TaxID=497735 RepID=A0A3M8C1L5_9BACL|nr:ankyrin repeat domain-containing protein [Brevibacillus panacihumi]RNB69616.1 ankyrin repeat domain-containing protein [Brevibacillus panacihumi]